ncbi:MAG: hypothetical protein V9G42_13680 [Bacteroidia bacterium]
MCFLNRHHHHRHHRHDLEGKKPDATPPPAPPPPQASTCTVVTPAGTVNVPDDVNVCVCAIAPLKKNIAIKTNTTFNALNSFCGIICFSIFSDLCY